MTTPGGFWGSDVPISMPQAAKSPILVDMGATGFTQYGMDNNISQSQLEDIVSNSFTPPGGVRKDG